MLLDPLPVFARAAAAVELRRIAVRGQRELVELAAGEGAERFQMRPQMPVQLGLQVQPKELVEVRIRREQVQPSALGQRRGGGGRLRLHQSTRAPEALTMRPHFSWSLRITRANSSGVLVQSSKACALRRCRISGERRASISFWLSVRAIAGASPAGATTPNHKSAPASL